MSRSARYGGYGGYDGYGGSEGYGGDQAYGSYQAYGGPQPDFYGNGEDNCIDLNF